MNTRRWLILSLALNLALGAAVAWAAFARSGGSTPFSVAQQLTNRTLRVRKVVRESPPATVEVTAPFHWSEIESSDYRIYMANLRAIGCPERTVRDIIVADVDELFIERLRQLLAPLNREFWQLLAQFKEVEEHTKHYEKAWEALKNERADVFKALLGHEDPFELGEEEGRTADQRAYWVRMLDFLSPGKQNLVVNLRESFDAARQKLWQTTTDHQLTKQEIEDRQQQQRELEADRDRQLAELLTPEELAEYRLRNSPGVDSLFRQSRVEFSEDELRAIARATAERQDAEAKLRQNPPPAGQQRTGLAQSFETQLQETLGPARYADYQRASDNRFEQISQVVERYDLPGEAATAVYDVLRQADAQAKLLRADNSRTVEERAALLQAIRDKTERAVTGTLGPAPLATYLKLGGDGWLQSLAAPPK
jgi:hypothetical protein